MSNPTADIFRQAAQLNLTDARRQGNLVRIEAGCSVLATGDVHGNRFAFSRILGYAAPQSQHRSRLILQELIHGPLDPSTGQDRSVELLLRTARLKLACPQQVLQILGNHDVAQYSGAEITKDGRNVCKTFLEGVRHAFGPDAEEVLGAIGEYLFSLPLAVRCPGGVLVTHSLPLPSPDRDCLEILHRPYTPEDFRRGGAVYQWTWGRRHRPGRLHELADRLEARFLILGHQHMEDSFAILTDRAVTLITEDDQGCVLPFSSDETLDAQSASDRVKPVWLLTGTSG